MYGALKYSHAKRWLLLNYDVGESKKIKSWKKKSTQQSLVRPLLVAEEVPNGGVQRKAPLPLVATVLLMWGLRIVQSKRLLCRGWLEQNPRLLQRWALDLGEVWLLADAYFIDITGD